MDHMKVWFCGIIERRCGPVIANGCTSVFNCAHRPENQDVRFDAKPSLDTIVGRDGNQAGTMSRTTLDIFFLPIYLVDSCASAAVWITTYRSFRVPSIILPQFSLGWDGRYNQFGWCNSCYVIERC